MQRKADLSYWDDREPTLKLKNIGIKQNTFSIVHNISELRKLKKYIYLPLRKRRAKTFIFVILQQAAYKYYWVYRNSSFLFFSSIQAQMF